MAKCIKYSQYCIEVRGSAGDPNKKYFFLIDSRSPRDPRAFQLLVFG